MAPKYNGQWVVTGIISNAAYYLFPDGTYSSDRFETPEFFRTKEDAIAAIEKWYVAQIKWVDEDTRFGLQIGDVFYSMGGRQYLFPRFFVCHDGKIFSDMDEEYYELINSALVICVMSEGFSEMSGIWIMRRPIGN